MKLFDLIDGLDYEIVCGTTDAVIKDIKNDSRKVG